LENKDIEKYANLYKKIDGVYPEEDGDPMQWEQAEAYDKQLLKNHGIVTTKFLQNTNMTFQYESPIVEKMTENIPVKQQ
jgi:hypothetical protein